jgi:hypothetical protein
MLLLSLLYFDDDLLTKYFNSVNRYHDLIALKKRPDGSANSGGT